LFHIDEEEVTMLTVEERAPDQTEVPSAPETKPASVRPGHPRLRRALRALRTFVVVIALLAVATTGGAYIVRERMAAKAFVDLGTAVLTAEAVPVGSPEAGVITEMLVSAQSHVTAGQDLARITLAANGTGKPPQTQTVRAPIAGTVSAVNVSPGAVARAGEPIVTLYNEGKLTFQSDVPVKELRLLRLGMAAKITGAGLPRPISATLDHVVPRVGNDSPSVTDRLIVVLIPDKGDAATVSTLVPGLHFKATVDTKTAAGATPAVNSAR